MKEEGRALAFTSLAHFANDGNTLLFPVLITYYLKDIPGASLLLLGSVAIVYNIVSGLFSAPIGAFADRHDADTAILSAGIFLNGFSVILFLIPFAYHSTFVFMIFAGALALGFGQSIYHPVGGTMLTEAFDRKSAPRALGINGAMGSLGRAVIPTVLVLALTVLGNVIGLASMAFYLLLSSAVILFGLAGFRRTGSTTAERREGMTMSQGIRFLYILMIVVFLRSMFTTGALTFVPDFLSVTLKSRLLMGYIITTGFAISIVGQPFFGMLQSRIGGRASMSITTILSGASFLVFLYFSHILLLDFITYSLYAFSTYSVFPVLLSYVNNVTPRSFSTRANSIVWGLGQTVGGAAGISVTTVLSSVVHLYTALWLLLIFSLLSMLMLPFMPREG